ncbi:MAG: hypothetical protein AB7G09_10800 [Pseudonocardia sp.]|jgi:hypothetical protein
MSLTGQLATGELGRWCAATLTGTTDVAGHVATRVQSAVAAGARPARPRRVDDPGHWATVGGALGQRLAFATHHAPPYYALLGARRAGLTDAAGMQHAAAAFPTHAALDPARAARANQLRPLPGGRWLDLDALDHAAEHHAVDHAAATPDHGAGDLVGDLVARLVAYLAEHAPPGQLARSRGAEAVLARACLVLTDWEAAYRTGQLPDQTLARYSDPGLTVDALLGAAPDHQVNELVDLATRAHHAGLLARLAPAPPAAEGIAGPVFVPHWADGDLLLPTADPPAPAPGGDEDGDRAAAWCCSTSRPSCRSATPPGSGAGSGSSSATPGSTPPTATASATPGSTSPATACSSPGRCPTSPPPCWAPAARPAPATSTPPPSSSGA